MDFLEGHRHLSHSLLGLFLFYFVFKLLLILLTPTHLDINIVNGVFAWRILSHLLTDFLTEQGVPWLYPVPWKMGFPQLKRMRIKTGKWFEKLVIVSVLLMLIVLIYFTFKENLEIILKG